MSSNSSGFKLSELLANLAVIAANSDRPVFGLALDSREIKPGYLFLACPGQKADGRAFMEQAQQRGAVAIVAEAGQFTAAQAVTIPVITIENLAKKLSIIAARFYHQPSQAMQIIAVTGTSGKTSCTQFIAKALQHFNMPCGMIGTLGYGFPDQLLAHNYTTPDAVAVQRILAELYQQSAQAVAMEVSSHALEQGRVNAVDFNLGIFTNLSREHLDYHGDMENYAAAKHKLFEYPALQHAIINVDDAYGEKLAYEFAAKREVFAYTIKDKVIKANNVHLIRIKDYQLKNQQMSATVYTPWGKGILNTPLLGDFNLSNLLAVLTTMRIFEIPLTDALACLAKLRGVPGRMEIYGGGDKPRVVIDYAHKPDALKQVLTTLRRHCQGKLWCVFGCGGERDRGKRSIMGYIAQQHADHIILTDDNPRNEIPQHIVNDIMQGMSGTASVVVEHDRRRAIAHALACAKANDIVLVAGKGHENYQQVGNQKLPLSDVVEVRMHLDL